MSMFSTIYSDWDTDTQHEEPARCEADHKDGGVCASRLNWRGECPNTKEHK